MKKARIILIFLTMAVLSDCDNTSSDKNKETTLFLLLCRGPNEISFNDGSQYTWYSPDGFKTPATVGPSELSGYYGARFLKDSLINEIDVYWIGTSISQQTFTQASANFNFAYIKNGVSYQKNTGYLFTLTISSVGCRALGSFSGTLLKVPSGPDTITISGTFDSACQ